MENTLSLNLTIPKERIAEFCRTNKISGLAIFGSALREDFGPDSDKLTAVSLFITIDINERF